MVVTFGDKRDGVDYKLRYGVYAIVPNPTKDALILVQAPNGAWFLPGGEIEQGENHKEALMRELHEELGFKPTIGAYLGQADEYFYSSHRDTHYHNPAYLYEVTSYSVLGKPLEDFNQVAWFSIEDALKHLKRGSHQWGIKTWLDQAQKNLD